MKNIFDYIDLAKKRTGAKSDRALCKLLEISPNMVISYNKGVLPNDQTMIKLARLAGVSEREALLDLNIWRSTGAVQKVYMAMKQGAAACLYVACFAPALFPKIAAAAPDICCNMSRIIYITLNNLFCKVYYIFTTPFVRYFNGLHNSRAAS